LPLPLQPALAEGEVAQKVGTASRKAGKPRPAASKRNRESWPEEGRAATGKGLEKAGQWIEKKTGQDGE
jgi:hypothetical protein